MGDGEIRKIQSQAFVAQPSKGFIGMDASFVIASLMSAGADISSTNAMGETALHIAIMQKAPIGSINALAECIDVNTRDASNKTCLHVAAQYGSEEAMETIIFFGGREQRDSAGMTALMYACRRDSDVASSLLISTSVDQINHVDSNWYHYNNHGNEGNQRSMSNRTFDDSAPLVQI